MAHIPKKCSENDNNRTLSSEEESARQCPKDCVCENCTKTEPAKPCPKTCPCGGRPLLKKDLKFGAIFGIVFKGDQQNFIVRHAVSRVVYRKGLGKMVLQTLGSLHSKLYSQEYLEKRGFASEVSKFTQKYRDQRRAKRSFEVSGKKILYFSEPQNEAPGVSEKSKKKVKGNDKKKDKGKGKERVLHSSPQQQPEDITSYCSDAYQDPELDMSAELYGPSPYSMTVGPSSSDLSSNSGSFSPYLGDDGSFDFAALETENTDQTVFVKTAKKMVTMGSMELPFYDVSPVSSEKASDEESHDSYDPSSEMICISDSPVFVTPMEGVTVPQEPAPQEPAPQEPAPQEPAPQEPAPQEPAPQEPAPQEPAPQEPAPQEPVPKGKDKKKSKKRGNNWTTKKSKKSKPESVSAPAPALAPTPALAAKKPKKNPIFGQELLESLKKRLQNA